MRYNFKKASDSTDVRKDKLAAIQSDLTKVLDADGIGGLQSRPDLQYKIARLVRETVMDGFAMTDPTPIFTERRTGELGNKYEYTRLINTFRAVKYAPMSEPLIFTPRKAKYTITTAPYELPFGIDLQKILTRQHTVAEFSDMASEAVTRHYVNLVLTAVNAACGVAATDIRGRNLRTNVGASDVTQTALDAQLRRLYSYGGDAVIFGHRWALDPILDMAAGTNAADVAKEELRQRGWIGTYRGAALVAVEDDFNEFTQAFTSIGGVDWEKLLFLGTGQPGAILLERDMSALNWQELDAERAWFRTGIRWDHGILVHSAWRYGVLQMT